MTKYYVPNTRQNVAAKKWPSLAYSAPDKSLRKE